MRKKLGKAILFLGVCFFTCLAVAFGQTKTYRGMVTDSVGSPISGATVSIKGKKIGTTSASDGAFQLKVSNDDILHIVALNYQVLDFSIGSTSEGTIVLKAIPSDLGEVVVTTGLGIKRQAKQLGYSTAIVSNKEINEVAVTNVLNGLSGKVSGVDIRLADNTINPNVLVTFRGNRSIAGNNGALIIVDGNPVDQNYLASLNPLDIQDVNILKGPQGAAIYGKDASNGVMIITLKKGVKGHLSVDYKNSTMFNKVSYMPNLQYEYSPNGGEGGIYIDPLTGMPLPVPYENQNYGPAYNSKDFPFDSIAIG